MFATRINGDLLKELKHLSVDAEVPIGKLIEEAVKDLIKKHKDNRNKK